jgi:hypothetical protein
MRLIESGSLRRFVAATVLLLGGVSLLAAGKPTTWTPVTATFRCADGVTCATSDGVRSDGQGAYTRISSSEGAFLNQFGGFTIKLVSSTPDRFLWLDLSNRVPGTDGPCGFSPSSPVAAREAELRINVEGPNGTVLGLENLNEGSPYAGFGILNYSDGQANVIWTVRWNTGDVTVTRTAANAWTIQSSTYAQALLQCTVKKGRTPGGDEAVYTLPFLVTVTKP